MPYVISFQKDSQPVQMLAASEVEAVVLIETYGANGYQTTCVLDTSSNAAISLDELLARAKTAPN